MAAIPLNNSRLKGNPFELGYLEVAIPGSGDEVAVVVTAARYARTGLPGSTFLTRPPTVR